MFFFNELSMEPVVECHFFDCTYPGEPDYVHAFPFEIDNYYYEDYLLTVA